MEEIGLFEIIKGIWKRKLIIIFITIFALIIGILCSREKIDILSITKQDSEEKVIYARTSFTVLQTENYVIRENTVNTYLNIMTSTYNMKNIIEKYDLDMEVEELVDSIYICRMDYSEVIELCIINEKLIEYSIDILNDLLNIIDSELKNIYSVTGVYMIESPYIIEIEEKISNSEKDNFSRNDSRIDVKNVIIVTLAGMIIGLVVVAFLEVTDGSIKSESQINNLKIDNLTIISGDIEENLVKGEFRKIKLNLKNNKSILFTSLCASKINEIVDGILKLYAQYGKKVVLIDITNEKLDIFAIKNKENLKYELKKMDNSFENLIELLETEQINDVFDNLKKDYDVLIIKGNDISESINTLQISKSVDGTILIVEERRTKLKVLEKNVKNLEKIDSKIIGTVIIRK